jgi:hypothetical protein
VPPPPVNAPGCGAVFVPERPGCSLPVRLDPRETAGLLAGLPPVAVTASPWHRPPFRALTLLPRWRGVLNVPAAADAAANAAGIALAAAEGAGLSAGLFPPSVTTSAPVVTPAAVNAYADLFSFTLDEAREGVLNELRWRPHAARGRRAVRLQVTISTAQKVLEVDLAAAADDPVAAPVYVAIPAKSTVTVRARNADPHGAYLLEVALDGWTWPVRVADDAAQAGYVRVDPSVPGAFPGT